MWWLLPVIPALRKPGWEDRCEIEASLGYMDEFKLSLDYRVRSCPKKQTNKNLPELSCQGWQTSASLKGAGIGHLSLPLAITPHTQTHTHMHTHIQF